MVRNSGKSIEMRTNPRLVPAGASPGASAAFDIATEEITIGSAPGNDLVIGDPTVSRRHAKIARDDRHFQSHWRLTDLGATNGTYVNGRRISGPVDLNNGDEVRFGAAVFHFAAGAPPRRPGFRAVSVVAAIALIFAAGFAITLHIANFSRLDEADGLSPVSSRSIGTSPLASGSAGAGSASTAPGAGSSTEGSTTTTGSVAAGPTVNATAGLEAPAEPSIPVPSASSDAGAKPVGDIATDGDSDADDTSPDAVGRWLGPLNRYRKSAGLAPVAANSRFSHGDYLHSRYIVKNLGKQIAAQENLGAAMHFEDPSKPWYSVEGAAAGRAGDVDEMWDPQRKSSPSWALDNWMQSPFHRLPILNPHLHSVGYGYYCEGAVCIASLNLNSDVDPLLSAPAPLATPIEYPPDGASIEMNSFDGEWPDPLTSCDGYSIPAGFPITIQLGSMVNTHFTCVTLARTAPTPAVLETCAFDGNSYRNPDPGAQRMMREQLTNFGAIVIMPRVPLTRGDYTISIAAGGRGYSWSFSVQH
jgi:uncharacterized protein YkwD